MPAEDAALKPQMNTDPCSSVVSFCAVYATKNLAILRVLAVKAVPGGSGSVEGQGLLQLELQDCFGRDL